MAAEKGKAKSILERIKLFSKMLYRRLVQINDSPQRIALGFGLGVFLGILPGTGPVAALLLAALFRVNKAAAFAGGLVTNTWLSFVTIVLAIRIGSAITGLNWEEVRESYNALIKDFHWKNIFDESVLTILKPLIFGYIVIGLVAGVIGYCVALVILKQRAASRRKSISAKTR